MSRTVDRIADVEGIAFDAGGTNRTIVVVTTDSGVRGVGEAGHAGRELAILGAVDHFKPLLVGQDPARIEHLWQLLFRGGFIPATGVLSAALSAVDIALWDIRGKVLDVPVYELLGGRVRDRVVCYPHNREHETVAPLLESCRLTVDAGWKFVRWGLPPRGLTLDAVPAMQLGLEQLAAVRETFGPDIEICIDIHTRLDPADAIRFCKMAEPFRPYFIEDPIRVENLGALKRVRAQTSVPIAAGEQYGSKWEFRALVEEDLIDYARIDVCLAGGLTESRKIAGWCETHYVNIAPHNPLGPVSTAACLHLALATPNFGVQELPVAPGADPVLAEVFPVQMAWADGYLLPPDAPGLGVEFDRDAALKHGFTLHEPPHLRRSDGSITNW